jgi:HD-GYP domain-containing protein (c-di-GMP phosphodiesterase class II)
VLDVILRLARGALAFSRSAIVLVDHENQDLVVRAELGYGEVVGRRLPIEGSITGSVVQTGEPILVRDVSKDPRYIEGSIGAACEMAVPLRVRGEVIGVIDAESDRVGAFSERDMELMSVFAVHAATAIHNARLFRRLEDTNQALRSSLREMERLNVELEASAQQIRETNVRLERQLQQLRVLHRAGQAMTATLDLDQTLDAILAMTREIIDTSAATIRLLDEESHEMLVRATNGTMPKDDRRIDVPLRVGDRLIGVFELGSKREIVDEERRLLETMASQAAIAIENARLFEDTQRTYYTTLRSLASALEARDAYTRGHSDRVAMLSRRIAERLGLAVGDLQELHSAAMLHDIGKIGVRDDILLKPARLTEAEMDVIRRHPALGDTILGPLKFLGRVATFVKHHHERWDGTGYPEGLAGENIPLPSRIVAVADCYDALTTDRPYRDSMSGDRAIEEIRRNAGTQFDPVVVDALIGALESSE